MTPTLETEADRIREREVARAVEHYCEKRLLRMKKFFKFDYALVREGGSCIDGFVELKCRKTPRHQYRNYMISEEKIRWGVETWNYSGTPCWLVVAWSDFIGAYQIKSATKLTLVLSGRMDEHDQAESEPCYLIPVKDFQEIPA